MPNKYIVKILLFLLFILWVERGHAAPREDAIKAGLVFNFAVYSSGEWFNPSVDSHYIICSASQSFVNTAQSVLKTKVIKNRPVQVVQTSFTQYKPQKCHTYFFTSENPPNDTQLLKEHRFKNTMLIGEEKDFISKGGHINFIMLSGKLRFEINPTALTNNGINISSKVIRLGKVKKAVNP